MCAVCSRGVGPSLLGPLSDFMGLLAITAKDLDVHLQLVIGCQLKSYQDQATRAAGKVTTAAKDSKASKYSNPDQAYLFMPVAIKTYGPFVSSDENIQEDYLTTKQW